MGTWELFATDLDGVRQAIIETYSKAEAVAKINDISTWSLDLPTATEAGRYLSSTPFARVEFVLDAEIWRSGPVTKFQRQVDLDGDHLTVSGVDDTVWLGRRLAHPEPGSVAPPYDDNANDVHTGSVTEVLSALVNVNAGPLAIPKRQVPGLTVVPPVPGPAGPPITVQTRWQNLLTVLQDTARPAKVMFEVVDMAFRAFVPGDQGAVFSAGFETLAGWTLTTEAPTADYVVVGGGGQGTARLFLEKANQPVIDTWGRIESFIDQRQTVDPVQLDKAATEALAAGAKPVAVTFVPIDTPGQRFGHDWRLGDTVTVVAGDLIVVDQVREVHVTIDPDRATVVPSVGQATGDLALFRTLAGHDRRLRQLERI